MNKLTIFLSHSHKDIEKVRKLREIFESLDFEPLIFYLQCLDDDNGEIEEFIKREIDARNVFIYCKSKNAEGSTWVQKELQYIKESHARRLYTIDIDLPFNQTLVTLLNSLSDLIKQNNIFISCSSRDENLCNSVKEMLVENGYNTILRYEMLKKQEEHDRVIREVVKNGIFLPIITRNYMKSLYCMAELEGALLTTDYGIKPLILPLVVNYSDRNAIKLIPRLYFHKRHAFDYENEISEADKVQILNLINNITKIKDC